MNVKTYMNNIDSKSFLFYSNHCDYCNDVINVLNNFNLTDSINVICIDNQQRLPQVVDRVPMIITSNNKIIADDDVVSFITEMYNNSMESISALMDDTTSAFSFIDEDEEMNEMQTRKFEFITDDVFEINQNNQELSQQINMETQTKGNKLNQSIIDQYENQRKLDDNMFNQQRRF
jgi:hypothetical protein